MSTPIRIFAAGCNKAFKQALINSLFSEKLYGYSIIHKQQSIFIFKHSEFGPRLTEPRLNGLHEDLNIVAGEQIVGEGLIYSYFQYRAVKRQTDSKVFLIEAEMLLDNISDKIRKNIEIFDLPELQWQDENEIQVNSHYIKPDLIVVALDYRECFEQNLRNIQARIFKGASNKQISRLWVVQTDQPITEQDKPSCNPGDFYFQINKNYESFRSTLAKIISQLCLQKNHKLARPNKQTLAEIHTILQQTIPDRILQQPKDTLLNLQTNTLYKVLRILSIDFRAMKDGPYHDHMKAIGQTSLIKEQQPNQTKSVVLAVFLFIIIILTGKHQFLVLFLCIIIAHIEQNHKINQSNILNFEYEKEKQWVTLYSDNGIARRLLTDIRAEISRRQSLSQP